ncbi:FKBP-type peptidyl-prolyl cis-trans isomerase [Pantoea sp. Nvir]|uniref:FKBP-type peptidyl-prolyl cis-trans isomerase n=1 Tax=Pantoea sp. Nvir TaxID=2576760 RepID=UPI00135C4ECB|nr:FKBP-type peptidyl-prolyl cis-trans isomerase [Pantoea sp. Nvir]MXP66921.1 FKBP-type peptidyl-prolyl cis-trans isomerase [Pantoea sp. Nvir]CAJ0992386.1 FKBP-type peptidyl-prolyl cis-trans isomerase FkpA [Pantoea sp. Nvir]
MKSLFKVTTLATIISIMLHAKLTAASTELTRASDTKDTVSQISKNTFFKNEDQQSAYALGASLARYMNNSLEEQKKLGIKLDKQQLLEGVQDMFAGKSKLSEQRIEQILHGLESRVKGATQEKMEKEAKENADKGIAFANKFAKESGVKKTESGLLYKIEKEGSGDPPQDDTTVVVHYKGMLINGTEFDNSYTRGQPLSLHLQGIIPGWTEGLKHVKKGGKIKLVIPPQLAYGKNNVPGIPINSTLVFDIELLDIKTSPKKDDKARALVTEMNKFK